ncbi:leucine-zipper-like transcriptional regulator [Anaeramoeba flamelloides]|uniref:Leucine-zipper-like transcriptional regulator n=1 Tax=Anaeramoeba flamelloides TaxID=1746091 RepID=A0AAV7ZUM4_9EUKA|nr:leucine-zipper-like transcriptional regulator [Anaeramoeba flamelloides]
MSRKKRKFKNILWSKETEIKYEGREGCTSVVVGDLAYFYGGFLSPPSSKCTTDLFCYNIALRTIKLIKPRDKMRPPATIGQIMAYYDSKLWIYGGQTTAKGKISITNKMHYFDFLTKKWIKVSPLKEIYPKKKKLLNSSSSSSPSSSSSTSSHNEGSEDGTEEIEIKNRKRKEKKKQTKKDRKKFVLPHLTGSSVVVYKNEMIIVGGFDGKKHNDQIYSYNLENNQFKELQFRKHQPFGEIKIEDKNQNDLDYSNSKNEEVLENVELDEKDVNINSNGFRARYCHSSCLLGDTMFIYGGRNSLEEFSRLYQFNIPDRTYFCSKIVHGKNPTKFADHKMVTISESRVCVIGYQENLKITTAYLYNPILMSWECLGGTKQFLAYGNTLFTWKNNIFSFGGNLCKNIFRLDLEKYNSKKPFQDKYLVLLGKDLMKFWIRLQNLEKKNNLFLFQNENKNKGENNTENMNKVQNNIENMNKVQNNTGKGEKINQVKENYKEKKKEEIRKIRKKFNLVQIKVKSNKKIYFYKPILKIRFPNFFQEKKQVLNQFKKLSFNSAKIFFKFLLSDKLYLKTKNVTNKQIKNIFQILIFSITLKQGRFVSLCKKWLRTIINPKNILTILILSHKANLSSIKYFALGWCSLANYTILKNLKNEIQSLSIRPLKGEILTALKPTQIVNYKQKFGDELSTPKSSYPKDMKQLFKDKQSSDIQFRFLSEEKPLNLHSFILAARSDFLKQLIVNGKPIDQIQNGLVDNNNSMKKNIDNENIKQGKKEEKKNKQSLSLIDNDENEEEERQEEDKAMEGKLNISIFFINVIIEKIEKIQIPQTLTHKSNQQILDRETKLSLKNNGKYRYDYVCSLFRYIYGLDFILTFQNSVHLVYTFDSMGLHHNTLLIETIKMLKKNLSNENIIQILQISEKCKLVKLKDFLVKKIVKEYWSNFLKNEKIKQLSPQLCKELLICYTREEDKKNQFQNF